MAEIIFSTSGKHFFNITKDGVLEITGNTYVRYNNTGTGNWIRMTLTVPTNKKWTITQIFTSYTSYSSYNAGYGFTKEARSAYDYAKNSSFDYTAKVGTYGSNAGNTYTSSGLSITLGSGTWYLYVYVADQGGAWQFATPSTKLKLTYTEETDLTASTASVPNFTMGTKGTIAINRSSSAVTHKLSVTIGGTKYQIASGVTTSYAWTPDVATWGPRVPNATSAACTMTVDTYNGGTLVGSASYGFTLYVPASIVPTISTFTTELINDNSVVKGWGIAVKNFTKIKWAITAAGAGGSTIKKYAVAVGGLKGSAASGTTAAIASAGNVTPSATVTDSRGRTASKNAADITVYDYAVPNISSADAYRCSEDGGEDTSGAYVKLIFSGSISSVNGKNSATYQYRYKTASGSYGSWTAFESGVILPGFATDMSYVIEMRVVDALGNSKSASFTIATREEWLHGKEGGKGAAFGKVAEEDDLLDIAWNVRVRKKVTFDHADNQYAPAGYVSGSFAAQSDVEFDEIITSVYSNMLDHTTKYITVHAISGQFAGVWTIVVNRFNAGSGSAIGWCYGDTIQKAMFGGVFQPWEWVNPPMSVGVEYRTTERFKGKAVYVKVFDFGAMPNNSYKSLTHGLTTTAIVSLSACSQSGRYYFPSSYKTSSTTESVDVYINASSILISTIGDWSAVPVDVIVKYTKD